MLLAILLAWTIFGFADARPAAAGDRAAYDPDFAAPGLAAPDSNDGAAAADPRDFTLHFQVGVLMRLVNQTGESPFLNLDLSGLFGDPRRFTWGVGAHLSLDSDDCRVGLKIPCRFPLDRRGKAYFQVSPGVYLLGDGDTGVFGLPGYFCELEVGQANLIAAVFSVEVFPYESHHYDHPWGSTSIPGGSFTNVNAGLKVGQLPGVITGIVLVAIGAAVAASYSGFGS